MENQNTNQEREESGKDRWDNRSEHFRKNQRRQSRNKKSFFGLALILFGVWWLLRRMDIEIVPYWVMTWPMLLIIIGAFQLVINRFKTVGGYIMVLIGSIFLAKNVFNIPITIEPYFWPVVVILIGLIVFFKPGYKGGKHNWKKKRWDDSNSTERCEPTNETADKLDTLVIMGGTSKEIISKDFQGGEVTTFMGGAELYFGNADMTESSQLELTVVMGGVKLVVPSNWDIVINTTNILGGVEDKRRPSPIDIVNMKTLTITGTVIMGGIEIKSY
jgi:predicted membrane protein